MSLRNFWSDLSMWNKYGIAAVAAICIFVVWLAVV